MGIERRSDPPLTNHSERGDDSGDWHGRSMYARQLGTVSNFDAGQYCDTQSLDSHSPVGVGHVMLHSR